MSGVLAAVAYTPTRRRGMSTPSETMLTATIHGSVRAGEGGELGGGARLGVQHHHRHSSGRLAQQLGDPPGVLGVGGDDQAGRVAVAVLADALELGVGLLEDPRQPVGQVGGDRRAVAPARLPGGEHGLEAGLDDVVPAAPRQRAVVGDEAHRAAHRVGDRLGVAVGDVGLGHPVGVVADAGDRRGVGAKGGAGQQQPPRALLEGLGERHAPGQLLSQMMRLVGDDQRPARERRGPSARAPWPRARR